MPGEPGEVYTRPHLLRLMLSRVIMTRFMTPAFQAAHLTSRPESQPETPISEERMTSMHYEDARQRRTPRTHDKTALQGHPTDSRTPEPQDRTRSRERQERRHMTGWEPGC